MAVTRVITVLTEMACCRDGQEAYHPLQRPIRAEVTEDGFDSSLTIWRDRAERILYDKYNSMAEEECSTMGTLSLCLFNLSVLNVDEFGKPEVARFIYEQIQLLEERMERSDDIDEYMSLKNELNRMKERYGIETLKEETE